MTALGGARQAQDLACPLAPDRDVAPGGALGEDAQRQPGEGGLGAGERVRGDRGHLTARAGRVEQLGYEALEHHALLGELGARLRDVALGGGVQLAQHRQDLGADAIAREGRIVIRRVVGERQACRGGEPPGVGALEREQRADHPAAASGQPEDRPPAGRDREAVEHRLGHIGAGVAGGDPVGVVPRPPALGRGVAGVPGGSLDVAVAELGPDHLEVDPEPRAEVAAGGLVGVGALAQAVVDRDRGDVGGSAGLGEPRGRAGRVGASRDEHDARRASGDEAALADRGGELLDGPVARSLHRSALDDPVLAGLVGRVHGEELDRFRETLQGDVADRLEMQVPELAAASATARVTITSPPSARATTRWVRFTCVPK